MLFLNCADWFFNILTTEYQSFTINFHLLFIQIFCNTYEEKDFVLQGLYENREVIARIEYGLSRSEANQYNVAVLTIQDMEKDPSPRHKVEKLGQAFRYL